MPLHAIFSRQETIISFTPEGTGNEPFVLTLVVDLGTKFPDLYQCIYIETYNFKHISYELTCSSF